MHEMLYTNTVADSVGSLRSSQEIVAFSKQNAFVSLEMNMYSMMRA